MRRHLMCHFGIFGLQIQHISEHILTLQEKSPAFFPPTHAKMNLGDHFCEALLGGSGGSLPQENFEILVLFGGI